MSKITSITVIGRRWFDRVNGNTYHAGEVLVNGKHAATVEYQYGYGDQYIETAAQLLDKAGLIDRAAYSFGGREPLWRYCEDHEIAYSAHVSDVSRKRDL